MPREIKLGKPAWISAESMRLIESMDEKTGEKKLLLEMNLIPFGKVSRNGILYNKEATLACLQTLVGRPLLDNHNDEAPLRESAPFGHFIKAWYDKEIDMAKGTADLDPAETDIIRKIRRGDVAHCSIQVIAGRAVDRDVNGQSYAEAYPDEFLEASLVKIEGFKQATLVTMIAEAFRAKEDITQPRPGETSHVQMVGGEVQGKKCPNCGSDKVLAAPNVVNGYSCSNCGNQYSEPKETPKEDVTTGNAGGMVGVAMPKPTDPFDLKKFKALFGESEKAAREYAEHYVHS